MRLTRKAAAAAALVLSISAAVAGGSSVLAENDGASASVPSYQHVWVIMLENHAFSQVIGVAGDPFINELANKYGLATQYFGVTHPSEPNYVAMLGGSFFGIQDDAPYNSPGHTINAPSLASQLESVGKTWKDYQQSMPSAGFTGTAFPSSSIALYASKHNGFLNFASIQNNPAELAKMVPDEQLGTDLLTNKVPNFSFIAPDQCHDLHGIGGTPPVCTGDATLLPNADAYVKTAVQAIQSSQAWREGNNAIVVTADEDDFENSNLGCCDANPGGGHVATIVITNHGPRGLKDSTPYNHYSLLATLQKAFGLGCLQNTCDTANVKPMAPLFQIGRGD